MQNEWSWLLVYTVFLGALMSPGPDFMVVMRSALGHSAKAGVLTAAGIAAGLAVHFTYCVAGIGLLIAGSPLLFNIVRWAGAGYLLWIGVQLLRSPGRDAPGAGEDQPPLPVHRAFRDGFLTNLLNPKATMFFLALFSQMIDADVSRQGLVMFSALCLVTAFSWFSVVALVMTTKPVRQIYLQLSVWLDRLFGLFFVLLAVRLVFV